MRGWQRLQASIRARRYACAAATLEGPPPLLLPLPLPSLPRCAMAGSTRCSTNASSSAFTCSGTSSWGQCPAVSLMT